MATRVKTVWSGGMTFTAEVNGHQLIMDADPYFGGTDQGPRPKPLLLAALCGCSGMDVVSILGKMGIKDYTLEMDAQGESAAEHPIIYHTITITYNFQGNNLPADKIAKAVNLSLEKYCAVSAMLKKAAKIIPEVYINNLEVQL